MLYFNKVSGEVKPHMELCRAENASIGLGLAYGQWIPVTQDPYPVDAPEGTVFDLGKVEMRGEFAFQPWVEVIQQVEEPAV